MNVGRGYVIQNSQSVSQSVSESVTKVGIELLGQLKIVATFCIMKRYFGHKFGFL